MKIKKGFMLREVAGSYVVVNVSGDLSFNGMITLNDTGAYIWRKIEEGLSETQIADALSKDYEVDRATAEKDTKNFIEKMNGAKILE